MMDVPKTGVGKGLMLYGGVAIIIISLLILLPVWLLSAFLWVAGVITFGTLFVETILFIFILLVEIVKAYRKGKEIMWAD